MSLLQEWRDDLEAHSHNVEEQNAYWEDYLGREQKVYQKLLAEDRRVVDGTFSDLAAEFELSDLIMMGFLDGISESLNEDIDLDSIERDSNIHLDINWEKLYTNMLKVPADWLYELEEWENILTPEKRQELTRAYKDSKTVHVHKVGRNDPCPCGSGKKYKKCCGKNSHIK